MTRTSAPTAMLTLALALAGCGAVGEIGDDDASADIAPGDDGASQDVADVVLRDAVTRDAADDVVLDGSTQDAADDVVLDGSTQDAVDVASRDVVARDAAEVAPTDAARGGCPGEMVLVEGRVCVDRWEGALERVEMDGGVSAWSPYENPGTREVRAVSRAGQVPQGYITGEQAQRACVNAGKRLCAMSEWLSACRGPQSLVYPYGNSYVRRRCNEARTPHPVVQFYGTSTGVFTFNNMNNPGINMQPDTVAPTGSFSGCESPWGAFDMVGNLHEWIADPAGTFKGGFYVDAEINGRGCLYTTTAHAFSYRDYSTGFRCCADPR
ncbi:MAG: SUMF1/EgtB/PvdO family nonheme iron enzyme [Polyangiales bacterium]